MKYILTLAIALICFSGCKKDKSPYQSEFDASLKKWREFKASVNNSYMYTRTTGSWSGFGTTTKIAVENGVITFRWYTLSSMNGATGQVTVVKTWVENQSTINTHNEGAPAITIDEIYTTARRDWLSVDQAGNYIYFETDANGILKMAGFVPKGCQDDCFTGATIQDLEKIQ